MLSLGWQGEETWVRRAWGISRRRQPELHAWEVKTPSYKGFLQSWALKAIASRWYELLVVMGLYDFSHSRPWHSSPSRIPRSMSGIKRSQSRAIILETLGLRITKSFPWAGVALFSYFNGCEIQRSRLCHLWSLLDLDEFLNSENICDPIRWKVGSHNINPQRDILIMEQTAIRNPDLSSQVASNLQASTLVMNKLQTGTLTSTREQKPWSQINPQAISLVLVQRGSRHPKLNSRRQIDEASTHCFETGAQPSNRDPNTENPKRPFFWQIAGRVIHKFSND